MALAQHCLMVFDAAVWGVQYLVNVSNLALAQHCLMMLGVTGCCVQYLGYVSNKLFCGLLDGARCGRVLRAVPGVCQQQALLWPS